MTTNFIESCRLNWFHGVGIKVLGRLQGRICPRHSSSWSCQHPLAWGCMAPLPSLFRRAPFTSVCLAFCLDQISVYLSKNDTFRDFRPSMKIIPTKTHLKIVSKATFMDLKKWLSLRGGGSFSSLPMWAFTSYGCGAIPPGQTWCLKQEKLVLSQCWAGRCQNHVFLTEMPRAHTLQRLQSEVHPFLPMFLGWWPHHSYSHTGLFSVCATFYLVCTMVPSSKETKGPNGESSRLSTSRSLMPSHLKDLVSKWGSLYRFQGLAFGYLLVDHFSLFRIH